MSSPISESLPEWKRISESGEYEESVAALESIVALLDAGELTLQQSVECFEIGAQLSARCQQLLERAELRIELVQRSLESVGSTDDEPPF